MIERRETGILSWPKEYDPDLEIVEVHPLYIKILKPKRLNKPTRRLTTLMPKSSEISKLFDNLKEPYFMEMDSLGRAGDHYHRHKVEVFCPIEDTPLFLYLEHTKTKEKTVVTLVNNQKDTYVQYVILPGVTHTIINPSIAPVSYLVLSNVREKDAIASGDIIEQLIDISTFPSPNT